MGRRTAMLLDLVRLLRTTDPKYSFEVFMFNITLGIAAICFTILGETRLWMLSCSVLWLSCGIHYFRLRRVMKWQIRREQAWLDHMVPRLEQALANYERAMDAAHQKPDSAETARLLALLREDVERAREREAASGE